VNRLSMRRWWRWLTLPLLLLLFAQAAGAASRTSLTVDEGLHMTSGYTILRTGDFRLVEEHPPLVKVWAALPLLPVSGLADPGSFAPWAEAASPTTSSLPLLRMTRQLLYPYRPIDRLVLPSRAMMALLAVLLGAVALRWAADLSGWGGGLLALLLLTFDPNILAHAAVVGTDLGAACWITVALFTLARFLRRPDARRLFLAGVALGLALGSKLSAMMLLPIVALLGLLVLRRRRAWSLLSLLLLAALVLWATYGFEIGSVPGLPFPVPAASHVIPWMRLSEHAAEGHPAFLMGQNRNHGWWYYFPVAFVLKTPLPTLSLLIVALIAGGVSLFAHLSGGRTLHRAREATRRWGPLTLFSLIYGVSVLFSPLNIGYRHLLPLLPPLLIFSAAQVARLVSRLRRSLVYALLCLLLLWLALPTLLLFPHHLAYFNELAGGPDGGWRYLADSNTDWGQAFKDLARFQEERGLGKVYLSAFVLYDPGMYGVRYEALPPLGGETVAIFPSRFNPPPGDYVISASALDGIPLVDPEMYDWFRKHKPDARIGHVLFYYNIAPQDPAPGWVAQCTTPVVPLSPQAIERGFGRTDLRLTSFDCTQAWLYPGGGETPGWYVFFHGEETEDPFVQAHRQRAKLAYEQRLWHNVPPFAVYDWSPRSTTAITEQVQAEPVIAAPSDWQPLRARTQGTPVAVPLGLSGPLSFLGYQLKTPSVRAGEEWVLWTYWSVEGLPDRPLSLMVHLLDEQGRPLAVGDGLGVPRASWQEGDLIVQQHVLQIPEDAVGTVFLQTGAYWLDTMERWSVRSDEIEEGDRILLAWLEIR